MFSSLNLDHFSKVALALAQEGGQVLKKYWGKIRYVQNKEFVGELVTEADKESEHNILTLLRQEFPEHNILAEESGRHSGKMNEFLWIIDPLDGTTNYAHQFPMVSVSVALFYNQKPIVGVVYNPINEELFQAVDSRGATLNGKPIHVSKVKEVSKSLLSSGFPYDRRESIDNNYSQFCHLTNISQGVRRGGSAALDLAYVAAGRFDGYWERISPWDMAAGVLLVTEGGGKVTSYDGSNFDILTPRIVASNGYIHDEMVEELKKCKPFKIN